MQKIIEAPFSAVKVFLIKDGTIIAGKFFKSNWEAFNYLENIKPSDKNNGLIVSSATPLPVNDIKLFMDGRLLGFYAFVSHGEDKIPMEIDFHYRLDGFILNTKQPYFLFSLPESLKTVNNRKKVAAIFSKSAGSNEIAENIKLMEDAGYSLLTWKTI
ncbi:MAG TPA: hypothetical protein ENN58_02680, partial [bacterium]|nr:hypothetical protein [bacterium]